MNFPINVNKIRQVRIISMKKIVLSITAIGLLFGASSVKADEGMWQPNQLPTIAKQLTKAGLKLNPNDLTDLTGFPMGAIVSLGGCTASFVSDKGLVATNHHCVYGSVQYNSTAENNLLKNGFLAKSFKEELPATPGSRIYVTEEINEVTQLVKANLTDNMSGSERYKAIDKSSKTLVAACEDDDRYRCSVVNFHGGLEYYLFKQLTIRDVRLVHAPASSVGKYGGDIDNWMWPRHTGDYGFYRAYVGKDGQPADYSKDNVPYEPKHHLKVNKSSVDDGDYIMVLGYPGRTNRYRTAYEVDNQFTWVYPQAKAYREEIIDLIHQHSETGSEARIKYESTLAGLANYAKNYGSMIHSFNKGSFYSRKQALESDIDSSGQGLFAWINPQRVLALAGAAGAQKEIAPLAMVGVNSMRNIAIGMGTAKGINRFKFVIDMPKTGFRGFIPTVQHSPSFKLAGKTDFIVTLGLPSKADFVSIESSSGAMASSTKMQGYYDFKKAFSEKVGIEIEDVFAILGQDINFASDESGVYTALRLKDEKKFNEVLAKLVKTFDLKHEIRTISGQEYHHLLLSTFQSVMAEEIEASSVANDPDNGRLLMRFLNIPSHLYWQQEDGYLIMASVPQVLMDRHYASPQISAAEWYEKEQRIDPKGALFMATMRNKGVPASMYRARLAVLASLGDAVGRPVDLFSLPTVREANLPKEGAFGVKLTSAEDQLALEFAFESNPAEVLFAGNAYAGVMMTGVLASIAIPAYEDYLIRAKVNMGLAAATRLKNELQLFKLENNHYPIFTQV